MWHFRPTPSFRPEQLWLGKQQKAASLQTLSKEDKERVISLAASVWDDEDAIGGYNYGDNDDDGREYEQIKRENERQSGGGRGEDLTYDGNFKQPTFLFLCFEILVFLLVPVALLRVGAVEAVRFQIFTDCSLLILNDDIGATKCIS